MLRFRVENKQFILYTIKSQDAGHDLSYMITDSKLNRILCYCGFNADASLICEALNKQEAYTLEQMKLPLKLSNKNKVIPIDPIEKGEKK